MTRDITTLTAVSIQARAMKDARERLKLEAAAWIEAQLVEQEAVLEAAVIAALEDKHSVTDVARAYTTSGKTPNRNAIHAIKKKHADRIDQWVGNYPFEWVPRQVATRDGERTVYDIFTSMSGFGPDEVTGQFTWRFDVESGETEPILEPDAEPYPVTKYYKQVLNRWLATHPYPGGE